MIYATRKWKNYCLKKGVLLVLKICQNYVHFEREGSSVEKGFWLRQGLGL